MQFKCVLKAQLFYNNKGLSVRMSKPITMIVNKQMLELPYRILMGMMIPVTFWYNLERIANLNSLLKTLYVKYIFCSSCLIKKLNSNDIIILII